MITQTPTIEVHNARIAHSAEMAALIRTAYGAPPNSDSMQPMHIAHHIRQFPKGQFVALDDGRVVGLALTMLTHLNPDHDPLPWMKMIGGYAVNNHNPDGAWLYGIDFAVHPDYRQQGIGSKLYKARFELVRHLDLRGFYAGGMLMGYHHYHTYMTPREYGEKVIRGDIKDPTVTMQMNRGFRACSVIPRYTTDPAPYNSAMLIVWDNPDYDELAVAV